MKKLILTLSIAVASYCSYSQNTQWLGSGDVGIGTQYPNESLTIAKSGVSALGVYRDLDVNSVGSAGQNIDIGARNGSTFTAGAQLQGILDNTTTSGRLLFNTLTGGTMSTKLMINSNGDVGIGTTTPNSKLEVNGNIYLSSRDNFFLLGTNPAVNPFIQGNSSNDLFIGNNNGARVAVLNNGNVGIGTIFPGEKLTVKGNIHAAEVKVDPLSQIPDYVFEPGYKLPSLNELKAYVDENHHLPYIPSAKEIEKNGIQLGDMSINLLKTIEELSLHVIELSNQLKIQNEKITNLEKELRK